MESMDQKFKEAREYYRELLNNAKPIPEDILTVDRINRLFTENQNYLKFTRSLVELLNESDTSEELKNKFKVLMNEYNINEAQNVKTDKKILCS